MSELKAKLKWNDTDAAAAKRIEKAGRNYDAYFISEF